MRYNVIYLLSALAVALISCEKPGNGDKQGNDTDALPVKEDYLQAKSPKKGVSFDFGRFPVEDVQLLGPAITWSYNWAIDTQIKAQEEFRKNSLDFCPMIWNGNWDFSRLRAYKQANPQTKYLLAFNEPNLTDQARMTPVQAAQQWPDVVAAAKELGLKLISPAMNYGTLPDYHDPYKWLDEFFACDGVSLDDVDGIAVHCYMGSPAALKNYINGFKKYGKPIWLTEFCNWDNNNISALTQKNFLVNAITYLENDPDVFRYAWFIPRGNGDAQCHNSLITSKLPFELTELGEVFTKMSTFDKTVWYKPGNVIPAEHYSAVEGSVVLSPTSDGNGTLELSNLVVGFWAEYQVEILQDGKYAFEVRYNNYLDSNLELVIDGVVTVPLVLPNSNDTWKTESIELDFKEGRHVLRLYGKRTSSPLLNWFRITK